MAEPAALSIEASSQATETGSPGEPGSPTGGGSVTPWWQKAAERTRAAAEKARGGAAKAAENARGALDRAREGMERPPGPPPGEPDSLDDSSGNLAQRLAETVKRRARMAHDGFVLMQHSAKHGSELSVGQFESEASGFSSGPILRVEVWAAADLRRAAAFGEVLDSYCALAVGRSGTPWAAKIMQGQQVKTHVALRQRHPRWGAVCSLRLPREHAGAGSELAVRVMSANAMREDQVLGEARVQLAGVDGLDSLAGACTARLLGGGLASLSLRWSTVAAVQEPERPVDSLEDFLKDDEVMEAVAEQELSPRSPSSPSVHVVALDDDERSWSNRRNTISESDIQDENAAPKEKKWSIGDEYEAIEAGFNPSGLAPPDRASDPFEEALAFWTANQPSSVSTTSTTRAHNLVEELQSFSTGSAGNTATVNELLLQAPLTDLLSLETEPVSAAEVIGSLTACLNDLSPLVRSRISGALVERIEKIRNLGPEAPRVREEQLLASLLITAHGEELTELKRLIGAAGSGYDLPHVVFTAISDASAREQLLAHFAAAGGSQRPPHLICNSELTMWVGGFGAGGAKFPQGPVPGAMPLFAALGGRLTFLSARPPLWEKPVPGRTLFDDAVVAEATMIQSASGEGVPSSVRAIFQPDKAHREMNEKKTEAFLQFAQLHPKARYMFVGNCGESDIDFATGFMEDGLDEARPSPSSESEAAPEHPRAPDVFPKDRRDRAAVLLDLSQPDGVTPRTMAARRAELRLGGVRVVDTFAGAAIELFHLDILDAPGLRHAAAGCAAEFSEISLAEFRNEEVFEARRAELLRDLREVSRTLRDRDPPGVEGEDLADSIIGNRLQPVSEQDVQSRCAVASSDFSPPSRISSDAGGVPAIASDECGSEPELASAVAGVSLEADCSAEPESANAGASVEAVEADGPAEPASVKAVDANGSTVS